MTGEDSFLCSICFKNIRLEDCQVDEDGRPVHENCYAARAAYPLASPRKPFGKNPSRVQGWRDLCWKIMKTVGRR